MKIIVIPDYICMPGPTIDTSVWPSTSPYKTTNCYFGAATECRVTFSDISNNNCQYSFSSLTVVDSAHQAVMD